MLWFNTLNTASLLAENRHVDSTPPPPQCCPPRGTYRLTLALVEGCRWEWKARRCPPLACRKGKWRWRLGAGDLQGKPLSRGVQVLAGGNVHQGAGMGGTPGVSIHLHSPLPGLLMFHGFHLLPFLLLLHTPFTDGYHLLDNYSRYLGSAWTCQ